MIFWKGLQRGRLLPKAIPPGLLCKKCRVGAETPDLFSLTQRSPTGSNAADRLCNQFPGGYYRKGLVGTGITYSYLSLSDLLALASSINSSGAVDTKDKSAQKFFIHFHPLRDRPLVPTRRTDSAINSPGAIIAKDELAQKFLIHFTH